MTFNKIIAFLVAFFLCFSSFGQTDVGKINIDDLSDDQFVQLMTRTNLSGLPESEMEKRALDIGFSQEQVSKLKARATKLGTKPTSQGSNANSSDRSNSNPENSKYNPQDFVTIRSSRGRVFGSEFFSNQNLTFEPNLSIATPSNYILGPGDKITLNIYGYSEMQYRLEISPDGFINIPSVGPVFVSGLSIEEAKVKVGKQLATVYNGINTGKTSFQLVLGDIRSIRVTLIGEVQRPATYTLISLATIANALYLSGGPTQNGSFRSIDLVRNGKKVTTFDFYDFLLRGDLSKNMLLRDQDVIRVNAYTTRIELVGAVKRQAIYEIKASENLKDVIDFSGGFSDTANTELITVYRIVGREREIVTIPFLKLNEFSLRTGDSIVVSGIVNRFRNRISIYGSVLYPGNYSLTQTNSLKDLLTVSQLKESAFRTRGVIRRLQENYMPAYIEFNIGDVLSGKNDIPLVREDSVHIYDLAEMHEKYIVSINGQVNRAGQYDFADNMKMQDLLLIAGGFSDGASNKRIEVARRLRNVDSSNTDSLTYAIVDILDINKDLSSAGPLTNYKLQPFDIISVRKLPTYKEQVVVSIEGEVNYPGTYVIASGLEKLSDLVRRAGGLKSQAYPEGGLLMRNTYESVKDASLINSKLQILNRQNKDTANSNYINNDQQKPVGIRLLEAVNHPGSLVDIRLEEGDVLKVPKKIQTVQTLGAVNVAQKIIYREGMNLRDAILESGGYAINASKARTYVIQANGEVNATKHFLFFRVYPKLKSGAEIYVPTKGIARPLSTTEVIGISSSIAGMGAIIIGLLNFLKN